MRSTHTLGLAFVLNGAFALLELVGGMFTGSSAILSDAVHDLGDALGIGISYLFEKRSRRKADERYSVLGGLISASLLLAGSVAALVHALVRLRHPVALRYDGMIALAIVGVCVNGVAAWVTHRGKTLNEKAVFWHLLEDVLGWAVVLIGAVVMRLTDWVWLDPLLSVGVAVFVAVHAVGHIREGMTILLEKHRHGSSRRSRRSDRDRNC